ncbi:MAG: leucine-rich repeat domain-containing protein [Clostridia bacterium]|nr:leucine-rich repeat domain-containing protein [Clostridia bacterium]
MSEQNEFDIRKHCLFGYNGTDSEVKVPDGVRDMSYYIEWPDTVTSVRLPMSYKTVEGHAFSGNKNIERVILSENTQYIEKSAFYECRRLKYINLPDSLRKIQEAAFYGCYALEEIVIPDGITVIDQHAFQMCKSLRSVTLPCALDTLEGYAFSRCESLEEISLPEGTKFLGWSVFATCKSLKSITLPDSVTNIWQYCFYECSSLEEIKLPACLTELRGYAFKDCTSLRTIEIPSKLSTIESNMFENCKSLTSIKIPRTVKTIEAQVFRGCTSLTDIYYTGTPEEWDNIHKHLAEIPENATIHFVAPVETNIDGCICAEGVLVRYEGKGGDVTIPSSVNAIGKRAFYNCKHVKSIKFISRVEFIEDEAFMGSGIESVSFYSSNHFGARAFANCESLITVTLPHFTFTVGEGCFNGCTSLQSVALDINIQKIDGAIFDNCPSLTGVYYKHYEEKWQKLGCILPDGVPLITREVKYKVTAAHISNGKVVLEEKTSVGASALEPFARHLEGYLMRIEGKDSYSYDNSDDDRASDYSSSSSFVRYHEIEALKNTEAMLWIDGKIAGVVYRIKDGRNTRERAFLFDGSFASGFTVGYSASHSSSYTSVDKITLVKKGEDGAPTEGRYPRYELSENSSDL